MLGDQLSAALAHLTQLITRTTDPEARAALLRQHERLAGALQVLIDRMVDPALPEYAAATKALKTANQLAEAAKVDLGKLAATLESMSKAISKVVALAAAVGLA
jgi:methylphosphotriester-DNA--protein-cysteine methyltransferase